MTLFNEFTLHAEDGAVIFCYSLEPETARGVVVVLHGMAEHAARYHGFASKLANEGFCVYALDHRGHGKTGQKMGILGFFADHDGWGNVTKDILSLIHTIKDQHPNLPIYIFGHSMGSYLARTLMTIPQVPLSGIILSGTSVENRHLVNLASYLCQVLCFYPGNYAYSPMLGSLTFGAFNKHFSPSRTPFDWLSADVHNVDNYCGDPLCGFSCTNAFYRDLFCGLGLINNYNSLASISHKLPLLLLCGLNDPVSHFGKDIPILAQKYKDAGFTNVQYKVYPQSRHEILNDIQKNEVAADILHWLNINIHCIY